MVVVITELSGDFAIYLCILLVIDCVSLLFDYVDVVRWYRDSREIA